MRSAYLVARFTLGGPVELGVFSEPRPTPRALGLMSGVVAEASGATYEDACARLANYVVAQMPWLVPELGSIFGE